MGQTTYAILSKSDVKRFFQEVEKKLEKSRFQYQEIFKKNDDSSGCVKVITSITKKRIQLLKNYDQGGRLEQNKNLKSLFFNIDTSEKSEFKAIGRDTLNEYLSYIKKPKRIVVQNSNLKQFNALALFIGYWGILDFKSKKPVTLFGFFKNILTSEEIDKYGFEDVLNKNESDPLTNRIFQRIFVKGILPILLILIGLFVINLFHPFFINKFKDGENGILVMAFEGDKNNVLQRDLISSIENLNLDLNLEIRGINQYVDTKDGEKMNQQKAKLLGEKYKAVSVIWGNLIEKNGDIKIHPRITLIKNKKNQYVKDYYIIPSLMIENLLLPEELVNKPILLTSFIIGYSFYLSGNYEQALVYFESLINKDKIYDIKRFVLIYLIGDCFQELSINKQDTDSIYYKNAEYYLSEAIKIDTENISFYNRGNFYAEHKKYNKAFKDYNYSLSRDSNNYYSFHARAMLYYDIGLLDSALLDINKAIRICPQNANLYHNRGVIYSDLEERDKSISDNFKAIEINPNDAGAYCNIGLDFLDRFYFNTDSAISSFKKSLELDPSFISSWLGLGHAYILDRKFLKAKMCIKKSIKLDSTDVDVFTLYGYYYLNKGDHEKAVIQYNKAIKIDDIDSISWLNLSKSYFILGNYKKVAECFEKIGSNDSHGILWVQIGDYCRNKGLFDKAINCYLNVLKEAPNHYWVLTNLGILYMNKGVKDSALIFFNKVIEIDSKNVNGYKQYGYALLKFGNIYKAIDILLMADGLRGYEFGYLYLGHCYLSINENEKAFKYYKMYRDIRIKVGFKDDFETIMMADYSILKQYGITKYQLKEIGKKLQNYL